MTAMGDIPFIRTFYIGYWLIEKMAGELTENENFVSCSL